jgi:hypothetical protein
MEIIDPNNVTETFFDATHEVKIAGGIVRSVLFARQNGVGLVVARLAQPVTELPDLIQVLVMALAEAAKAATNPPGAT